MTCLQPCTPSCDMPHTNRRPTMTTCAPRAMALKTSAPVRIPESKMIVISAGANTTLVPATRLHDRQEEPRTRTVSYGLDDLWEYL